MTPGPPPVSTVQPASAATARSSFSPIPSRLIRDGEVVRRRRVCQDCDFRFSTYEEVVKSAQIVMKRDGNTTDFSRKKLLAGLTKACEKRPVTADQIQFMVDSIENALKSEYEREVPSTVIGQKVMEHLQKVDEVAYVRFASVYRRYRDVNQFLSEVEGLIGRD